MSRSLARDPDHNINMQTTHCKENTLSQLRKNDEHKEISLPKEGTSRKKTDHLTDIAPSLHLHFLRPQPLFDCTTVVPSWAFLCPSSHPPCLLFLLYLLYSVCHDNQLKDTFILILNMFHNFHSLFQVHRKGLPATAVHDTIC